MSIGACVGIKDALAASRLANGNADNYRLNQYIGKSFYDDENFRAVIECLDDGYNIAQDLIELMQDFRDNEREQARTLTLLSEKWLTRLKQQSSLASYHTTKRAQFDVVRVTKELVRVREATCTEIDKVIDKYRAHIDETYISERLRPGRKHRRSNEFKKLFKTSHASLREVSDELEKLRAQEKKAHDAVRTAERACEILELDPTTTDKHLARAHEDQSKKHAVLIDIERKIRETKKQQKTAQKVYRHKAMEIFKQCQYEEEERLNQIRETLLDFIQAMHTPKQTNDLNEIFSNLSNKVTTQQNSFDDLLFWAKTYGIESELTKSLPLTPVENDEDDDDEDLIVESRLAKKSSSHESHKHEKHPSTIRIENGIDDDEPSITVSAKARLRKARPTNTPTEKKHHTTTTTDPSSTTLTVLNHV
ncbi:unnamed protein product [Adineta ricciae]|uniref:F-BAR domain-containing protein n=1 Tax=Adineta ricciae TaxID=249248 RepID=A0A814X617_ADIRI|nr:unnamed protein product [Adineta ricciae]CAF1213545.1 unnamed protein product [Adineta ricciae]